MLNYFFDPIYWHQNFARGIYGACLPYSILEEKHFRCCQGKTETATLELCVSSKSSSTNSVQRISCIPSISWLYPQFCADDSYNHLVINSSNYDFPRRNSLREFCISEFILNEQSVGGYAPFFWIYLIHRYIETAKC